jgi:Peptidase A4 family
VAGRGGLHWGPTWVRGADQVEGAGVFRGQRRGASSRQVWWTRGFPVVVLAAVAASSVVVGAGPATARNSTHKADAHRTAAHRTAAGRTGAPKVFSHPAGISRANANCQPAVNNCPVSSPLWSGYLVSTFNTTYTTVSAEWVQPKTTCPTGKANRNAWTLFWVGLDGRTTRTVEQGGSEAQCLKRKIHYYAWWEMYPTNSVQSAFPVFPGDHISSSVAYDTDDDTYTVTVTDTTAAHAHSLVVVASTDAAAVDPDTYTITEDGVTTGPTAFSQPLCVASTPCENSSAEWIVEAPGDKDNNPQLLFPLAHFQPIVFQDANATDTDGNNGSISDAAWQYTGLDLTNTSSQNLASVGGLTYGGQRFRDVWDRA